MPRAILHVLLCPILFLAARQALTAPSIEGVQHLPAIPKATDTVRVQARLTGSSPLGTLRWRVDGAVQFQSTAMTDADGSGVVEATIPPHSDRTVVEFFVDAADASGARTWPASAIGALLQVDGTHDPVGGWTPGTRPIYRGILREVDRAALVSSPGSATFVGTLVSVDGTGQAVRYGCEFRSASAAPPQSFSVSFPELLNGHASLTLQSRFPHAQALGAALFQRAGLPVDRADAVRFRLNGADLAESGARMFGSYARGEPVDAAWVARQFPLDGGGNLYRVDDHGPGTHGELGYETPATAANYAETYFKITNAAANDYSDLIALTNKLTNAPAATYRADLGTVLNLDQWLGFLALDALAGNVREGLQSGRGDGFHLYRGVADTRFVLVPGELDTTFGLGENGTGDALNRSVFSYEGVAGLSRMLNHPDILPDYYAKLLALMDTAFTHAALDELIDQVAAGWVNSATIQAMKDFITQRRTNVSAQIPQTFAMTIATNAPDVEGIKTTTDGAVTVSGSFHVARVRSIRINGQPATLHYRASGPDAAGTWNCALTSGLNRGMNKVTARFHSQANGAGEVVHEMSADLYYGGTGTNVSGTIGSGNPQSIHWTPAASPYRLTGTATVPAGVTLVIEPGVTVFADATRRLIVNGIIQVLGTAEAPVRFSHLPGAPLEDDPREPGMQLVPPKWGGILLTDSLSPENVIRYADFVNAQPAAVEGSITVVRSECLVDHCSFRGTYLHGVYGKNCSLTVQDCHFPSVFPPGKEQLGEVLDNLSEFVEVDSPPNDPGVVGRPEFLNGFPVGGHLRLYRNLFEGSSGHNDLVDITSGKWGVTPLLDAQDNHFRGPTGDEHIDLNGDAYIAGNFFENCRKDIYTSDRGYANAVSSDLGGTDTTVVVARNVFSRVDHAVNVKRGSAVIFEHNTMADVNADYVFTRGMFTQNVRGSAVNFFIPEDSGRAGDGAYAAFNLCFGQADGAPYSRVFGWADMDLAGQPQKTTKIEMAHNFLDPALQDPFIGSQHPANVLAAVWQPRLGNPLFVDRAGRNYGLLPHSPARGSAPHGLDYGATVASGCYLGNVPATPTPNTNANITIGGPGIFAFKWRLDGGAWSASVEIAPGVFPRTGPTVRSATLALPALANGTHTLEVMGQDFAGNWQTTPATAVWTVNATLRRVVLSEIVADALAAPDTFELHNAGVASISLSGWFMTDDPAVPNKYPLGGSISAGEFRTFNIVGLDLNVAGDILQLYDGPTLADSIAFGAQVTNLGIGRAGANGLWKLCTPTPNAANVPIALGPRDALRFNEWLAVPGVRFNKGWIELANAGPAPVALEGVRISNNFAGNPTAYVFPALSFIGAGGYLKLDATGGTGAGELPFILNAQGDMLFLIDEDGTLDAVQFLSQTADVSMGRSAAGTLAYFTRPTGGFANSTTEPGSYRGWLAWHAAADAADEDGDGLLSLAEFGLGSDPRHADPTATVATSINGRLGLVFALPENPAVPQGHGRSEITYIIQVTDSLITPNWVSLAMKTPLTAWSGDVTIGAASAGFVPITVRDSAPLAANQSRFMRLRVRWTP